MATWAEVYEASKSQSVFLKLNDGESAVLAFVGDAEIVRKVWEDKTGGSRDPLPTDPESAISTKFRINAYHRDDKKMVIVEMTKTTVRDLLLIRSKYGFEKSWFELSRHGAKGNTKTVYKILPDAAILPEQLAAIKACEPLSLTGEALDADGNKLPF